MIIENNINPILISLGSLEIRWYGLFFALGILLAYLVCVKIFKKEKLPIAHLDSIAVFLFLGLVIGARMGHVLFYDFEYFSANPFEILKIWKGGLASHGAVIGLFISYYLWTKIFIVKFSEYADSMVICMPIVAMFVRIGNYFNSEIIGLPTNSNFGVVFSKLGESFPRHPVQLYEAIISFLTFVILVVVYKKSRGTTPKNFFMFLYMLLYFSTRFLVEFFKEREGVLTNFPLSMGQMLSVIPFIIAVVYFGYFFARNKISPEQELT